MRRLKAWLLFSLFFLSLMLSIQNAHAANYTYGSSFTTSMGSFTFYGIYQAGGGSISPNTEPFGLLPGIGGGFPTNWMTIDMSQVIHSGVGAYVALTSSPASFVGASKTVSLGIVSTGSTGVWPKLTLALADSSGGFGGHPYAFLYAEVSILYGTQVYLRSYAPGRCFGTSWCTEGTWGFGVSTGSSVSLGIQISNQKVPSTGNYVWSATVNGQTFTANTYGAQAPPGSVYWIWGSWPYGTTGQWQNGKVAADVGYQGSQCPYSPVFTVSPSSSTLTVTQGSSASILVQVNLQQGCSTETIALSLSSTNPASGVTLSLSPSTGNPTFTSSLTTTASANAATGSYSITIYGQGQSGTSSASMTLIVQSTDFSISASPSSQSVNPGGSVSYTVSASSVSGNPTVSFSAGGMPQPSSWVFSPASCIVPCGSTFTLATSASDTPGAYTITFTGTSGSVSHSTSVALVLGSSFDFSLNQPNGITVSPSGSGSSTVTATLTSGSTQSVSFSVSGLPSGASASFNPQSGYPTFSSTLTVTTSSSTPTGSYVLTVSGTGGGKTRTTSLTLTVQGTPQSRVCTYANPNNVGASLTIAGVGTFGDGGVAVINVNQWYSLQANVPGGYTFDRWQTSGSVLVQNTGAASTSVESTSSGNPSCDGNLVLYVKTQSSVSITVTSSPSTGSGFVLVDGVAIVAPWTFSWTAGSTHTLAANSPVSCGSGCQYLWNSWSDGGGQSHQITVPSVSTTYTATFRQQFQLTMQVGPSGAGTTSPSVGQSWQNAGVTLQISATATGSAPFSSWTGSGSGSYSGTSNPATVTMSGPITETANFGATVSITITSGPATGAGFVTVDGSPISTPQAFLWASGSTHTLSASSPVSCGSGCQYVWQSWSDGGAQSHQITVPSVATTYSASFQQQFQLTMQVGPTGGGTTTPSIGQSWRNKGATVQISATPTGNAAFSLWAGNGTGSYSGTSNPAPITMNGPITETAYFGTQTVTMTVSYSVTGGGSGYSPPIFNYMQGSTSRNYALTTTPTSLSADGGAPWSVSPNPLGGSTSSERWHSNQTLSGTASPTSLVFSFQHQYALTMAVSPAGAGSTTPPAGANWYNSGVSVTISATAASGYSFTGWSGTGTNAYAGPNNLATVTVSGPITETANFKTSTGFDFSVSVSPTSASVQQGGNVSVTVTVSLVNGPTQSVSLSVASWGGATGLTGTFAPPDGSPTFTSTLTISAGSTASKGNSTVTIRGTGGTVTRDVSMPLTVTVRGATYTITFHVNPQNAGSITIVGVGTFTDGQSVSLAAGGYQIQANPSASYIFGSWFTSGGCSISGSTLTVTGSGSGDVTANFQSGGSFDFAVFPSPLTETIQPGDVATFTVTVLSLSGSPQNVVLSVDSTELPSGVTAAFSPQSGSPDFTSTLTLTSTSAVKAGAYALTVKSSAGSTVRSVQLLLKIAQNAGGDFLLTSSPASMAMNPGTQRTFSMNVAFLRGYAASVSLGSSFSPNGVVVRFNLSNGASDFTSTVTISVGVVTTPGWYILEFTGTGSDGKIHGTHFLLVVNDVGTSPAFAQSLRPPDVAVLIPDSGTRAASLVIFANPLNGFSGTASMSATSAPNAVSVTLNPASIPLPPAGSTTISVYVASTAQDAVYVVSVTGTSGSLQRRADFALILFAQQQSQDVSVVILQPVDGATVSGNAVQVLANITNRIYGPGVFVSASFHIEGSGYDSGWANMTHIDNWDWQGYWDSTQATMGQGGPYTVTVQGTSFFNNVTATGQASITIYADNTGYEVPLTYYVNFAKNPSGLYPNGWFPETRFIPGEAVGVHYSTSCGGVIYVYVQTTSGLNASNIIEPRLANLYPWLRQLAPSNGYVTAVFPLAGIGSSAPSYGSYQIRLDCLIGGQPIVNLATLPFMVQGLKANWNVVNGLDSATVTATLNFNDGKPLLNRQGTLQVFGYMTQMKIALAGTVDSSGVVKIKVPYYAWEGTVNFQVAYGTSTTFLVRTQTGQPLSERIPYAILGVSSITSGQDYVEAVTINVFRKTTAQPADGWAVLQIPEANYWAVGKGTVAGNAAFTLNILTATKQQLPSSFTVQAWIYSLSSSTIYANQFSNLRIVREQVIAIPSISSPKNQNGELTISGTITLGTSTMSLSNVQVVVQAFKASSTEAVASTSFAPPILKAGVSNTFTATLASLPSGTYTIKVTVTDLTSGQVIGTSTSTVQVRS